MNDILWSPGEPLANVERRVIEKAFRFYDNNKTRTAAALEIAVRTLDAKLAQYEKQSVPTASRISVEPPVGLPQEQPLLMRERPKVQKVSSK